MKSFFSKLSFWLIVFVAVFVIASSLYFFRNARQMIGTDFPGFLRFENNIVGALNQFEWTGFKKDIAYHDVVESVPRARENVWVVNGVAKVVEPMTFSFVDFLRAFFVPFGSGVAFLILAMVIFFVARKARGMIPFVLFNLGVAYYLVALFDFHTAYTASWFFMAVCAVLPALMTHFALVYPEVPRSIKKSKNLLISTPYMISFLLYIPYVYTFYYHREVWQYWETAVILYMIISYLVWLGLLIFRIRRSYHLFARITAKYLLVGQLLAFIVPLVAIIAVSIFRANLPLNYIAPFSIALPVAALFGIILGNLRKTQVQLVQSEKMASLGQLMAGVAHEINNPTTFIFSNVSVLKEYADYLRGAIKGDARPFRGEMGSEEVVTDLNAIIDDIEEGSKRIKEIVSDLRRFVYSADEAVAPVDINAGIESTLHLLKHALSEKIKVHWQRDDIPKVMAHAGQLNQVWMNLLKNAIDALEGEGEISIFTERNNDHVIATIQDTGKGMPENVLSRIFDPFFTTKPEGEGTGLGLSICQQIVKRFGGEINITSEKGMGTAVQVKIPIDK